jgi:hypothetical protein
MSSRPFVSFSGKSLPLCPGCYREFGGVLCRWCRFDAVKQQESDARLNARRCSRDFRNAKSNCKRRRIALTPELEAALKKFIGQGLSKVDVVNKALKEISSSA